MKIRYPVIIGFRRIVAVIFTLLALCPARAEDWQTTDGKNYKSVTVISHDANIVTINTSEGQATFPISHLNDDLQKRILADNVTAKNWTTSDGKSYSNVKVISHDVLSVTIQDADGGVSIPLEKLPPDLQKKFDYDPVKAQAVAHQQAQEQSQAKSQHQQEQNADEALEKAKAIAISGAAHFRCKVLQVIPSKAGDALLVANYGPENYPLNNIVVIGLDGQHVDGDWVSCWSVKDVWYYSGTYQYTAVTGAALTCRIYSPNLELAVANLLNQSK